jgi:hypothetical protein
MPIAVSRHFTDQHFRAPLSLEDKITIFADRVTGWQIDVAERMRRDPHAGFAILSVLGSYFEMFAKHDAGHVGSDSSKRYFILGARSVLEAHTDPPNQTIPENILVMMYDEIRCGMYHDGMTGPRIIISVTPGIPLVQIRGDVMILDPHQLVDVIQDHFSRYVAMLVDPRNVLARDNFERRFDANPGKTVHISDA